ncbi:DUF3969 family protein [Corallococcus exercitus]|uniref:DUF3969 family protein n=1 Tax=Corallococcus exercitus TaxID=2316736 RepID=A0A3A8HGI2_9BACT|nr:DUF3969 family protein [Corallococcus exercitus]NOK39110.1 DUF3969 family protein [Corallococcus exercitus]RKG66540.1 DUF3969 family protein [Corallococcus exercitus]
MEQPVNPPHPPHETPSEAIALQAAGVEESQRFVAVTALGMCRGIALGTLSPAYACSRFLGPALLSRLEAMEVHPELRRAIHLATELEDVARLAPEALTDSLTEIEDKLLKVLADLPPPRPHGEKWLVMSRYQDG